MSTKEEFLKITSYQEYDKRREEFRNLLKNSHKYKDKEVLNHFYELYPKLEKRGNENGIIVEVYKHPRK